MTEKELDKALARCFTRTPNLVKRNSFGYNRVQKNNYKGKDRRKRKEVEELVNYAV